MILHVTDVSTWELYTKCMVCMLQVGVHCAGIICTIGCYGIGTIFRIVIVNMEYYIIVFIVRDSVFQIWILSAELNSGCFFTFNGEFDLENWPFSTDLLATSVWIFNLNSELETCTGNLDLQLGTHISVDMVKTGSFITALSSVIYCFIM